MKKILNLIIYLMMIIILILSNIQVKAISNLKTEYYHGKIEVKGNNIFQKVDLSNIEIRVYKSKLIYENHKKGERQFNDELFDIIYTNKQGKFSFIIPSSEYSISINLDSLPNDYGINIYNKFYSNGVKEDIFFISKVSKVNIDRLGNVIIENKFNETIYVPYIKEIIDKGINTLDYNAIENLGVYESNIVVTVYNEKYKFNNNFDLTYYNYYDKVKYIYNKELINEEEKISLYCDYVEVNNAMPPYNVLEELENYTSSNSKLTNRINNIIGENSILNTKNMTTIFSSSNNFIIHYNTSFTTIAEAERVAEIFEDVKSQFCGTASGQYGFNTPISSNSLSGEVYPYYLIAIIDLSSNIGGMCDISNEANGYSIIYIDIDEADAVSSTELTTLTSICAHEYFHAIMNIYGVDNDNGYQWFQECFASWAGVDYIGTTWHWPNVMSYYFLNTPGESLMSYSINERRYGSFLFVLTISQEFGGVNTIKEIIESAASGTYYGDPYGAINSGLQSINQSYTIGSAFYSCALFNSWPEKFYGILFGATSYIWNQATATIINPTATPTSTSLEDLNSMSSNYYNFDTSLTGPYTLNLIIDMKITGLNSSYTTNIEDFEIGTIYVDSQNQVSSGNISVSSSRTIYQINNFNTTNIEEVRIIPINIDQSLMLKYQITYNL